MDEVYVKVKGQGKWLYRSVDKQGDTLDFLLTAKRDAVAEKRFFRKALNAKRDQCQQAQGLSPSSCRTSERQDATLI